MLFLVLKKKTTRFYTVNDENESFGKNVVRKRKRFKILKAKSKEKFQKKSEQIFVGYGQKFKDMTMAV